jgi:hypothetical protein
MREDDVVQRVFQQQQIDEDLKQESIAKIKQNWRKHLALTATFAYRGSFIKMVAENSLVPIRLVYIISMFAVLYLALKQQHIGIIFFLLPALFSYGIHAFASHYISRFSVPLIPCLAIAFLWLILRFNHKSRYEKREFKVLELSTDERR